MNDLSIQATNEFSSMPFVLGFVLGCTAGIVLTLLILKIVYKIVQPKPQPRDPADWWREGLSPYEDSDEQGS